MKKIQVILGEESSSDLHWPTGIITITSFFAARLIIAHFSLNRQVG